MSAKQQPSDREPSFSPPLFTSSSSPSCSSASSSPRAAGISQPPASTSQATNLGQPILRLSTGRPRASVVEYYGSSVGFCGYCKKAPNTNSTTRARGGRHTFDMKAFALKPDDYQQLLDRGWRRSGDYCYHPINSHSCCPNYAISCKTTKFKLSRSQRLCIENLNSFLVYGDNDNKLALEYTNSNSTNNKYTPQDHLEIIHWRSYEQLKLSNKMRHKRFVKSCQRKAQNRGLSVEEVMAKSRERAVHKIYKHASLEDYLYPTSDALTNTKLDTLSTPTHKLELKLFHVDSRLSSELLEEENLLIRKYQEKIHLENPRDWSRDRFNDFLVNSPILVEPIPNRTYITFNDNLDDDTFTKKVYSKNYILVKPPNLPTRYGTYHCIYLLDSKLIAVGVLDILPKCVTTVYFFYDPVYESLNLGTYSALVEISMTRQITEFHSEPSTADPLIHYYLGYYVHECKKMHYKTQFYPSYLLCSETFQYFPTKPCLEKLKDRKYARFNLDPNNHYSVYNEPPEVSLNNLYLIPVMTPVTETFEMADYRGWILENLGQPYVEILFNRFLCEYARMIGMPLLTKMKLKIHSIHRALEVRCQKFKPVDQDCDCDD